MFISLPFFFFSAETTEPFIRKDDHGNKLVGLQCIVTKDFTAENPSEIDLYLNDWVELQRIDGNSYYGSVFGRSGQCEGWFHKSHVEVIPDSKVGSLTFRYVVRAEVNYLTEEAGFFSYRCGDKFDVLEEQVSVEEDRKHAYYRVRNKSGEMGLVVQLGFTKCQAENPVLYERQWYYPKMTRMEAEEELRASNADTFLVRDSSHAVSYYLFMPSILRLLLRLRLFCMQKCIIYVSFTDAYIYILK